MASTLPLNAARLVCLNEVVSAWLPLSTPTISPGPETENETLLLAVGTTTPDPLRISAVTEALIGIRFVGGVVSVASTFRWQK